jgi:PhzF family phenazine biosynthesis protein
MVPVFTVDAFAQAPFRGNPAAVCLLDASAEPAWMQSVAAEMNLSETAFLLPREHEGFDLRWFTPVCEVKLCGHATLAGAHVLWETHRLSADEEAEFHTASGRLVARRSGDGIEMDFPATRLSPIDPIPGVLDALGVTSVQMAVDHMLLVEVADEQEVRGARPDFAALKNAERRGVILTAASSEHGIDFVSRFFAPSLGIDEDPVTGSAHCCLGPYWQGKLGRSQFRAFQTSARGGLVGVEVKGERVLLTGEAVTVLRGELLAAPGR